MRTQCQFTVKRPEKRVDLTVAPEQQLYGVQVVEWVGLKEKTRTRRLFFLSRIGWELHVLIRIDLHLGSSLWNLDFSRPEDAVHDGPAKGLDAIVWMKVAKGDAERAALDFTFPLECPRNNFLLTFGGHL